jgi:glucosamine-6-phosphate deaminase
VELRWGFSLTIVFKVNEIPTKKNSNMKTAAKERVGLSKVEKAFEEESGINFSSTTIPYILVNNFPKLGLFTSLRFIEWVAENPDGVISLPTGKTPEFFIKWTQYILKNWNDKKVQDIRGRYGLSDTKKPELTNLQFVQIDEFYPISSKQHNSFYDYVYNLYIKGFGLDIKKALLINSDEILLPENKHFTEVFPDCHVDLSLRYRECRTAIEKLQQQSIYSIDNWCSDYEIKIREKGGLGFFLGGIGPDGHIAFNTRGSDINSTTRLTSTNFETQAVAASDLGGIEVSSNRQVITIGLETITYNPEAVAILIAAGEAKADIVKQSLENSISNLYPASVLSRLKNSRVYLTEGAASRLTDTVKSYYENGPWTQEKTERAILDVCKRLNKYGHRLLLEDLKKDPYCKLIPGLNENTVNTVIESMISKIEKGMQPEENQVFLHTGPHHDDILLGIHPFVANHNRDTSNQFYYSVLTSGFNAVTNKFVMDALHETKKFLDSGLIQMVKYPDFFEVGYRYKWDKDVYHYLTNLAAGDEYQLKRGLCHRIVRSLTEIYDIKNKEMLRDTINEVLTILKNSYDGEKNPPKIQILKGMIREFEEELVWAHFGTPVKNVKHMRLGFYKGDIFTEQPEKKRDVAPILEYLKEINPTVISLAFDPEGSGPDTHYKVLQAIAEALREWQKEKDLSTLRIWGYRNVWYRFNPAETNIIFPVSLNAISAMNNTFSNCYLSQVDASFPSYELNGKFCSLSQKIWGEQLSTLQLLLGKDFFYQHTNPKMRSSHGLIFIKEMMVDEFLKHARELEKSTEGNIQL